MAGWFGPKKIGYGITPRSWQGWLATILLVAGLIGLRAFHPEALGWPHAVRIGLSLLLVGLYLFLTWYKYEAP